MYKRQPFSKKNVKGSASVSLYISSAFMQIVVLLVYFSNDAWLAIDVYKRQKICTEAPAEVSVGEGMILSESRMC